MKADSHTDVIQVEVRGCTDIDGFTLVTGLETSPASLAWFESTQQLSAEEKVHIKEY